MNNKKLFIISGILCLFGLIIMGVTYYTTDVKYGNNNKNEFKEYIVENNEIKNLIISVVDEDIIIKKSTDNNIRIKYYENKKRKYNIVNESNSLTFERKNTNSIFNIELIPYLNDDSITVELPTIEFEKYKIKTISGDIEIDSFKTDSAEITSTSGEISINNIDSNSLNISTTSGDMDLGQVITNNFNLKTTSGDIDIINLESENVDINTVSGELETSSIKTNKCNIKTTSGDTNLENIMIDNLNFNSVSGNISGTISGKRQDYNIEISQVSGENNLGENSTTNNKFIKFRTTSGDINMKFNE